MRDIYLYEGTDVLKNLLNIRDRKLLDEADRHRFPTGGLMKPVRILRSSRGNADLSVLR